MQTLYKFNPAEGSFAVSVSNAGSTKTTPREVATPRQEEVQTLEDHDATQQDPKPVTPPETGEKAEMPSSPFRQETHSRTRYLEEYSRDPLKGRQSTEPSESATKLPRPISRSKSRLKKAKDTADALNSGAFDMFSMSTSWESFKPWGDSDEDETWATYCHQKVVKPKKKGSTRPASAQKDTRTKKIKKKSSQSSIRRPSSACDNLQTPTKRYASSKAKAPPPVVECEDEDQDEDHDPPRDEYRPNYRSNVNPPPYPRYGVGDDEDEDDGAGGVWETDPVMTEPVGWDRRSSFDDTYNDIETEYEDEMSMSDMSKRSLPPLPELTTAESPRSRQRSLENERQNVAPHAAGDAPAFESVIDLQASFQSMMGGWDNDDVGDFNLDASMDMARNPGGDLTAATNQKKSAITSNLPPRMTNLTNVQPPPREKKQTSPVLAPINRRSLARSYEKRTYTISSKQDPSSHPSSSSSSSSVRRNSRGDLSPTSPLENCNGNDGVDDPPAAEPRDSNGAAHRRDSSPSTADSGNTPQIEIPAKSPDVPVVPSPTLETAYQEMLAGHKRNPPHQGANWIRKHQHIVEAATENLRVLQELESKVTPHQGDAGWQASSGGSFDDQGLGEDAPSEDVQQWKYLADDPAPSSAPMPKRNMKGSVVRSQSTTPSSVHSGGSKRSDRDGAKSAAAHRLDSDLQPLRAAPSAPYQTPLGGPLSITGLGVSGLVLPTSNSATGIQRGGSGGSLASRKGGRVVRIQRKKYLPGGAGP